MRNMRLIQIADACQGQLFGASQVMEQTVSGVVVDSRMVEKNYLFLATVGERVDGHDYIDSAFDKGALAVVCEKVPNPCKGPYILVENSFQALKDIARWYRLQLDLKIVGITGSVGKTSTKEFISSVLAEKYKVLKTEGNFNNEVGLPLTLLRIREEHELAVLEMGISDFGEMHRLSEIAKPDIAVITNIGQCHLENLGTRSGVLKAKSEIFDYMSENGRVVVNGNDDLLVTIDEVKGQRPLQFGIKPNAVVPVTQSDDPISSDQRDQLDVYASDIRSKGLFGSSCHIHIGEEVIYANIPLPGEHMVLNALAAATVGKLLHLTSKEIAAGIEGVKPVGGRSNILQNNTITIIDDCYNANPVSMKAALDLLYTADSPKVAILGDMFELGANEYALHEEVGTYAVSKKMDLLVCVGKLSSHMYDGATNYLEKSNLALPIYGIDQTPQTKVLYFETRDKLIEAIPDIIKENSTILVKASHGMGFDQVVKALVEYNS